MNDPRLARFLWVAGLAIMAIGLTLAVGTLRGMGESRRLLAQKMADIRDLEQLERDIQHYREAQGLFEQLPDKRPAPLEDLVPGSGLKHKIRAVSETPGCVPGWTVRRKEVDLSENELTLAQVMELVARVERGASAPALAPGTAPVSPPWRMARCILRASVRTPGLVEAVLVFESVEKTGNP